MDIVRVASTLGQSLVWVLMRCALLQLHPDVLSMVKNGILPFKIGVFLSKYPDHTFQLHMAEIVTEKQLNSTEAKRHIECAALAFGVWPEMKRSQSSRVAVLKRLYPPKYP